MQKVASSVQWRWSKGKRSEAMENVVSVENDYYDSLQVDGGETLIFNMLEARDRDKDPIDGAGKALFRCVRRVGSTGRTSE